VEFKVVVAAEAESGEFGERVAAEALAGGGEGATREERGRWSGRWSGEGGFSAGGTEPARVAAGVSGMAASARTKPWASTSPSREERGGGPDAIN
jgi:hypothetical protein